MHSSYHSINNSIEGSSEFLISYLDDPNSGDHSWSSLPYQEILQSAIPAANHQITTSSPAVHHVVGQQNAAPPHELVPENGSKILMKSVITAPNSKTIRKRSRKSSNQVVAEMLQIISAEEGTSVAKKLHHNAKERIRRMKLNASYLALQALMPQSRRRSKKRWTAPAIVDRALKYIPELEKEVNALRSNKEKIVRSAAKAKNKYINADQSPTVLLNKVNQEEAIIQICVNNTRQDDHNQDDGSSFTNLLQNLENEGICIKTASTLYVCHSRICHNLHIQINHATIGTDYIQDLNHKVISWLR